MDTGLVNPTCAAVKNQLKFIYDAPLILQLNGSTGNDMSFSMNNPTVDRWLQSRLEFSSLWRMWYVHSWAILPGDNSWPMSTWTTMSQCWAKDQQQATNFQHILSGSGRRHGRMRKGQLVEFNFNENGRLFYSWSLGNAHVGRQLNVQNYPKNKISPHFTFELNNETPNDVFSDYDGGR